jgi:hypothetical protein
MSFAELLRELMDDRGLKPAEVARKVPCDKAYISRLASSRPSRSRNDWTNSSTHAVRSPQPVGMAGPLRIALPPCPSAS